MICFRYMSREEFEKNFPKSIGPSMSNPTGDALVARIKMLEKALVDLETYLKIHQQHSNYNTLLKMIGDNLK